MVINLVSGNRVIFFKHLHFSDVEMVCDYIVNFNLECSSIIELSSFLDAGYETVAIFSSGLTFPSILLSIMTFKKTSC